MNNKNDIDMDMEAEEEIEVIDFTDIETGEVIHFAVEDETELNGSRYLLVSELIPEEEFDDEEDYPAYILKEIATEGDETLYGIVDEEPEFSAVVKVFGELIDDDDTELEY